MPQASFNLADLFSAVAAAVPDRLALVMGDAHTRYDELDARAERLAAALAARGVARGDTVGLLLYNGADYLATFFAACKLGALPVNINYRYVADELAYIFDNAKLSALIYDASLAGTVAPLLPRFPALHTAIASGAELEAALANATLPAPAEGRSGDDLMLLYTGGTTGMPLSLIHI